nr:unnamed protein product [Spirometra erinaceieuropaei]
MHSLNQGTTALLTQHPSATYLPLPGVATGLAGPNGRCCATGSPGSPASPATAIALAAAMAASSGIPSTMKDSRWLTLEVCRQFQRKMCSRDENECKFAHPPPQVDVQNGRVICCYDSIKGKLLYPTAPPMNLANHGMASTYSLLGVGLGPYLNAMAASSLNPMAALNAAKAAAGPVSLANGSLPQLGLSGMISLPPTPAKRPALADAKSGLPMFQTEVPAVATVPMAATTAGLYALQTASVPQSVSDPSQMSVDATSVMGTADQQTGSLAKPSGQKTEEESSQATSFYPETSSSDLQGKTGALGIGLDA